MRSLFHINCSLLIVTYLLPWISWAGVATISENSQEIVIDNSNYKIQLSKRNGGIKKISSRGTDISLSNENGGCLWVAGSENSSQYSPDGKKKMSYAINDDRVQFSFDSEKINVDVTIVPQNDYIDFRAAVTPKGNDIGQFMLPGKLTFSPQAVDGVTLHLDWPRNVGMTLNKQFFMDRTASNSSGNIYVKGRMHSGAAYHTIFGSDGNSDNRSFASSNLRPGKDAADWLGEDLSKTIDGVPVTANRTFADGQAEIVIGDSDKGVFFGASRLGGKGYFFRVGGGAGNKPKVANGANAKDVAFNMILAAMRRVSEEAKADGRSTIAVIRVKNGPAMGWAAWATVAEWCDKLKSMGGNYLEIKNEDELVAAMDNPDTALIVNPYGEMCLMPNGMTPPQFGHAIRRYVRGGGSWLETAGYPFWYQLDGRFLELRDRPVPSAFADFFHFKLKGRELAIYSVQPMDYEPFAGKHDLTKIFTPSKYSIGGNENGGFLERPFDFMIAKETTWQSPVVRLRFGQNIMESCNSFCADNKIARKLSDKMPPEKLERLKSSVLYRCFARNIKDEFKTLERLPKPGIFHLFQYCRYGHDHGYPDLLPPKPSYASPEEFKRYIDEVHASGSLFMPYTNNTWWCPPGPTFARVGKAALVAKADGSSISESWGSGGATVTMWHDEVRKANDEMIRLFTEDYPSDIVFQDQVCSRTAIRDYNPASPTPSAYIEGLASTVRRDGRRIPLSSEDLWWGMVDSVILGCGHSFGIIPSEDWYDSIHKDLPNSVWNFYPLIAAMTHDKVIFTQHDLGGAVDNMYQMSLSLAFGFSMINYGWTEKYDDRQNLEWVKWLDRVQKSVCAAYAGVPLKSFSHDWNLYGKEHEGVMLRRSYIPKGRHTIREYRENTNDGVVKTAYGPVEITANLGPAPLQDGNNLIAPYGFIAKGTDFVAGVVKAWGNIQAQDDFSFVVGADGAGTAAWLYAKPETSVTFPLPLGFALKKAVLESGAELKFKTTQQFVTLKMPASTDKCRILWKVNLFSR
ncbi:hypothetical protein FYJ85_10425 [Victivallaceae bacterium BBE-744-WT-12]|uniref:DUF6259 domain-containing protein n=1 Tax=Victivallis lenta TaxID=2606640 RepID=A0A844G3A5_9BACT|nr:DUF6259 domain-containing protein [Victivallis lenta]MST97454.1 hypothetical protein [Victivallis lenta]